MKRFTTNNGPVIRFRKTILASLLGLTVNLAVAQTPNSQVTTASSTGSTVYSLRQCVEIALQNNIQARRGQLQVESSDLQLRQSRLNLLPNASFGANQSLSGGGRQIDPFTNTVIPQQSVSSSNYQLNSSLTIFNGFAQRNTIKQYDLARDASQKELLATNNTVALTVVQSYLNVLTYQEQLEIARGQVATTRGQLDRTQKLVNAGTLAEAQLYDLRAQVANDELAIVTAQNNLDLAKLALLQAMNVPGGQNIDVERMEVPDPTFAPYSATAQQVYTVALENMPDIQGADLRVRSAAAGVEVAKGALYPSLTLNASLYTFVSSTNRQSFRDTSLVSQQQIPGQYILVDGIQQPIFQTVYGSNSSRVGFVDQVTNNLNRSVSVSLRIPIFTNFQSRTQITTAKIQQQTAELNAQNARLTLRQNIETAYTNMLAGSNRFRATSIQVESLEQAFRAAESRFNAGALNSVDYNIAKNNLDKARANLVQAKFDYIFRTKILDFYQNKPLSF